MTYLAVATTFAQDTFVPADIKARGDRSWRRHGILNGNLIEVSYFNTSHINGLQWPTGSGHVYMDDLVPFVSVEAVDVSGRIIHPLESNYNWNLDISPDGTTEWGWQPMPGYLNAAQDLPAVSNKPLTWPDTWPDRPDWSGSWNGFLVVAFSMQTRKLILSLTMMLTKNFSTILIPRIMSGGAPGFA